LLYSQKMNNLIKNLLEHDECGLFLTKVYGLSLLSYLYESNLMQTQNSIEETYLNLQVGRPLRPAFYAFIKSLEANGSIRFEVGTVKKSIKVMRLTDEAEEGFSEGLESFNCLVPDVKKV
jgi:hypothetical protein